MRQNDYKTLYVYIDESGSIVEQNKAEARNMFFVVGMVFTDNPKILSRIFKKAQFKNIKNNEFLRNTLSQNKEIKGSLVNETIKYNIYSEIESKCADLFEIGIIEMNNKKSTDYFKKNKARVFNFIIKCFLKRWYCSNSKFKEYERIELWIDERNVATKSINTLCDYLETELNLYGNRFPYGIGVFYCDSKSQPLIQFADFIANTYFRLLQNRTESNSFSIIEKSLCNRKVYKFPYC